MRSVYTPGVIYLVTNTVNRKKYVGQTVMKLSERWGAHKSSSKAGSKLPLACAVRKYGQESFTVEVLAESLKPFLSDLEKFFIELHRSHHTRHGYNRTDGGEGVGCGEDNPAYGRQRSPEYRAKMSAALIGKKHSEETRNKMSISHIGRKFSEESRAKISSARLGKKRSEETRAKLRAAMKSKKNSNSSSKFFGVSFYKNDAKWAVGFTINGKRIYLGLYPTELEAAQAYDKYVIEQSLDRPLNFPQQQEAAAA